MFIIILANVHCLMTMHIANNAHLSQCT